mgnify:CR=1 FL=1
MVSWTQHDMTRSSLGESPPNSERKRDSAISIQGERDAIELCCGHVHFASGSTGQNCEKDSESLPEKACGIT